MYPRTLQEHNAAVSLAQYALTNFKPSPVFEDDSEEEKKAYGDKDRQVLARLKTTLKGAEESRRLFIYRQRGNINEKGRQVRR